MLKMMHNSVTIDNRFEIAQGKEKMRKIFLGLICLAGIMSCDMGLPKSVTIKGKPGVTISLGSPFKEGNRLEDHINTAEIRKMMDEENTNARLYNYRDNEDPEVQAYLIHYPIVEMKLDLSEYINNAVIAGDEEIFKYDIPEWIEELGPTFYNRFPDGAYFTRTKGPQQYDDEHDPLFTVYFSDMVNLVTEINGGPFGIEIDYQTDYAEYLWVKIPALGIKEYTRGSRAGNKLRFANDQKTKFEPKKELGEKGGLEIFVKVTGLCAGTIDLGMVFEWEDAIVDASAEPLTGEHIITNGLREYLGEGVSFKKAEGYIFVDGMDNAAMSIGFNGNNLLPPLSPLHSKSKPHFPDPPQIMFDGQITEHSLDNPIPLTAVLNNQRDSTLEYQIFIDELHISNTAGYTEKSITADMLILFCLEFAIRNVASDPDYLPAEYLDEYVKLDMGKLFPEPGDKGLSFTISDNNKLFSQLEMMKISLKNINNNIIDDSQVSILVCAQDTSGRKFEGQINFGGRSKGEEPHIIIPFGEDFIKTFPNPFRPGFYIILKKDGDGKEDYATLRIKQPRNPDDPQRFDFHLAVELRADIDYTINLEEEETL
jgi:hypothetical protein